MLKILPLKAYEKIHYLHRSFKRLLRSPLSLVLSTKISCVQDLLAQLGEPLINEKNQCQLIIAIDSTHSDTYRNQEQNEYNAHYQSNGYHPLLTFE